jgi:hypothetical protein
MADLLDQLHINAFLDRLRADTGPPALVVYPNAEGFVPINPPPPYVRVWTTIDRPIEAGGNALTGLSTTWTTRAYVHSVGLNEYSAAAIRMRVRVALLDFRPTIAGRSCGMIRHEASQPPQRDEGTGTPVFDMADTYRLLTFA